MGIKSCSVFFLHFCVCGEESASCILLPFLFADNHVHCLKQSPLQGQDITLCHVTARKGKTFQQNMQTSTSSSWINEKGIIYSKTVCLHCRVILIPQRNTKDMVPICYCFSLTPKTQGWKCSFMNQFILSYTPYFWVLTKYIICACAKVCVCRFLPQEVRHVGVWTINCTKARQQSHECDPYYPDSTNQLLDG